MRKPEPIVITPPSEEPISLALARKHLRLDLDLSQSPPAHYDDELIAGWITGAREAAEAFTQRALAVQVLEIALDSLCGDIELPMPPLVTVDSVKYIDANGDEQTLASTQYTVDTHQVPPWIVRAKDVTWPSTYGAINDVKVRYTAGYATADLPKSIRSAMLLTLGHLYENREDTIVGTAAVELPMGAKALLWPWRIGLGA